MELSGVCYTIGGVIGMIINLVVALAIIGDKSMQNPTYKFMVFLAVSDVEALFGLLVGPGLLLATDYWVVGSIQVKIVLYCGACGFRLTAFWMALVAVVRWAAFAKEQRVTNFFNKKGIFVCGLLGWVGVHLLYSPFLYYPDAFVPFGESGSYLPSNNTFSKFLCMYFDEVANDGCLILQLFFNSLSFALIIKMRNQVLTPELRKKNKAEIKLYVQCMIDSCVYASYILLAEAAQYGQYDADWISVVLQVLLFLNHVDCAVLYLCFNRNLRQVIVQAFKKTSPFPITVVTPAAPLHSTTRV